MSTDAQFRFKLIFDALEEASSGVQGEPAATSLIDEAEEIAELRRVVLEVTEPTGTTLTTT